MNWGIGFIIALIALVLLALVVVAAIMSHISMQITKSQIAQYHESGKREEYLEKNVRKRE